MSKEIVELNEDVSASPLYSEDLAPVPIAKRTWNMWDLAAIWVGMAVCIPTYLLASQMIISGLTWLEALSIIVIANLIITIPMVLNGHAGVKFGIPFPVVGRASFGTNGIHIAAVVRGIIACGWFGIQTWFGGLAFYAIWCALTGTVDMGGLTLGKFVAFGLFWLVNVYFIWNGTESIKWLEKFSAPILIAIGILLIVWGAYEAKGFGLVLDQSKQLGKTTALISKGASGNALTLQAIKDKSGKVKADAYQLTYPTSDNTVTTNWKTTNSSDQSISFNELAGIDAVAIWSGEKSMQVKFRIEDGDGFIESSAVNAVIESTTTTGFGDKVWEYLLWLTGMVGFWATMAISIADITRYTSSQSNQVKGQFIGLPGTMALFSFVGIFVTCAAVINFKDVLIAEDAPWDPITLLGKFESPIVVVIDQIFMLIATLSTNIAANVIAPANAFSNLAPKMLSFRGGGMLTAVLGILICPWWLLNDIIGILVFVSGLLGPVLAIIICDYYLIRQKEMQIAELFKTNGQYSYGGSGINSAAMIALTAGVLTALVGFFVEDLAFLYKLSWFSGFIVAFVIYYLMMNKKKA